jgi:L-ascorbate metabolism protein UlaG (beta-lactamase superfamily)
MTDITITLIGGPTALIELCGFRFLTDPTFDGPGEYPLPHVTLRKTAPPSVPVERIGPIDAVLLSHEQHPDNLDSAGRAYIRNVPRVLTTRAGADRIGGTAQGLAPWQTVSLARADGEHLTITATPARHGPAGIEALAGDVIGFVLSVRDRDVVYVTGDTVWYHGIAEIARRHSPRAILVFAGAAKTRGPFHLTMNTNDVLETAHEFPDAVIVPVHCDGWAHFSETRDDLEASFRAFGLEERLRLIAPGARTTIPVTFT